MSGAPRAKTSPLRATVPLSCVTKQGSGLRSPDASFAVGSPRVPEGAPMRRTASLDAIYLRGLFPRETLFYQRDKGTQTERSNSLDSLQNVEDKMAKMTLKTRRRSCSREERGDVGTCFRSPLISKSSPTIPPKSSRNSEEGLNRELELYASAEPLQCDRLQEPVPEGRKAPVAELIRERPFSRTRHSANHNSSDSPLRDSPVPTLLDTPHSETEDSQGSSPDQERPSPQINRFSSRAPPDGCERTGAILRPVPRELATSQPNALFTLKPSSRSAFQTPQRVEDATPQVPDK